MLPLRPSHADRPGGSVQGPAGTVRTVVCAMRAEDRAEVMRIEAASFPNAWTARDLERFLARPHASGHVLERAGKLVGFFVLERTRDRVHIANLAVDPDARRSGVGTLALLAIDNIAWAYGLRRIELEVRETNLAAQLLYRSGGYRAVQILRAHYGDEDGYRMVRILPARAIGQPLPC